MHDAPSSNRPSPPRRYAWAGWLLLFVGIWIAAKYFPASARLQDALQWISGLGATGMLVFVLLYIVATVLLLPGSILTIGAGAVFGLVKGFMLVSLGANLGAVAAFLVGRHWARSRVVARLADNPRFTAIDQAVAREGWKIVALIRLSPLIPFVLLNYALGITGVKLRDYVTATLLGMLPGTLLYVYLGAAAGDVAGLGRGEQTRTPLEWTWYAVGLLVTIGVTVYVTRLASRSLNQRLPTPPPQA